MTIHNSMRHYKSTTNKKVDQKSKILNKKVKNGEDEHTYVYIFWVT